jgi:sugar O-acyltransferase (sialic acid O-acetyltransferase NeuD family)
VTIDVVGAGGHAKVLMVLLEAVGHTVGRVVDANPALHGATVMGRIIEPMEALQVADGRPVVIAIGGNVARKRVATALTAAGHHFATAVHPHAWVAPTARLGAGAVVFAGAVVQPDAELGEHVIVNTGASVDHDCRVGAFAHVGPGTHLAGDVTLGEGVFLGVGVSVIQGLRVGDWTVVGAGGSVVRDLPGGVTAVGVPARPLPRPAR